MRRVLGTLTLLLLVAGPAWADPPRAFPEAQGYGALATTTCLRTNIQLLAVTNTSDRDTNQNTIAGSFRKAIQDANNKVSLGYNARDLTIIYFTLGGRMSVTGGGTTDQRRITLNAPCVHIAGQTAPGGGFWVTNGEKFWILSTNAACKDHIVRYLTFAGFGSVNFGYGCGGPAIFDHLSSRWSSDYSTLVTTEFFNTTVPNRDVTFQRMLVAEPLAAHPVGSISTKAIDSEWKDDRLMTHQDYHHNLLATSHHRLPLYGAGGWDPMIAPYTGSAVTDTSGRIQYGPFKHINNVVYNWELGATEWTKFGVTNSINNLYKRGPATPDGKYEFRTACYTQGTGEGGTRGPLHDPNGFSGHHWHYAFGNIGPNNSMVNINNYTTGGRMHTCTGTSSEPQYIGLDPRFEVSGVVSPDSGRPLLQGLASEGAGPTHSFPIIAQSVADAYDSIVTQGDVGATKKLNCDGTWASNINTQDQKILTHARSGTMMQGTQGATALPATIADAGGYPSIAAGSACTISGGDGIPDAWKARWTGACPGATCLEAGTSYKNTLGADGWLLIEHYLNNSNPFVETTPEPDPFPQVSPTYPTNSTPIFTFDGTGALANAVTLTGNGWERVSGVAQPTSGFSKIRFETLYEADQEAWCEINPIPAEGGSGLYALFGITDSTNHYSAGVFAVAGSNNDTISLRKLVDGTTTHLISPLSLGRDIAAGDKIGARMSGTTLTLVYCPTAVGQCWNIGTVGETAFPVSSYLGIASNIGGCTSFGDDGAEVGGPDVTAPTAPGAPTVTVMSVLQTSLVWAASTDAVGVTSYRIFRGVQSDCSDCVEIGQSVTATLLDSTIVPSTTYYYRVTARDAAANESTASGITSARVPDSAPATRSSGRAP